VIEWRAIPGFDNYEVSEYGDVRRCKTARGGQVGKLLKGWIRADGYRMYDMRRDGRTIHRKAHQLVAANESTARKRPVKNIR
jgi:hypothetical protein